MDVLVEHQTSFYDFVVGTLGTLPHILDCDTEIIRRLPASGPVTNGAPA